MRRGGTTARDRRAGTHQGRFLAVVLLVGLGFAALVGRLGQVQLVGHDDFRAAAVAARHPHAGRARPARPHPRPRGAGARRQPREHRGDDRAPGDRRQRRPRARRWCATSPRCSACRPTTLLGRTWLCGEEGAPPAPACWAGSPQVPVPLAEDVDPTRAPVPRRAARRASRGWPSSRGRCGSTRGRSGSVPPRPSATSGRCAPRRWEASRGLVADDLVGRSGLEQQYDAVLRGVPGRTVVSVDARGLVTGVVSRTDPVPGRDLVTSLDVRVQAAAEKALATQMAAARTRGWPADSGAVVVLDPRTGAVAALASAPTYDPNIWTGGISQADYAALTAPAAGTPLLSRAIGVELAPASTMKPASVAAAVRAGNPLNGTYDCPAKYRIGNRVFNNHETSGRGLISFRKAIQISCDTVFYAVAYDSWRAQGGFAAKSDARDPFVAVTTGLGLGARTGIDLPGEASGRIPDRAWKQASWEATKADSCRRARTGYPEVADRKQAAYLKAGGRRELRERLPAAPGDAANFSIGQGDVAVTPLQMAVMYAAIANGGTVVTPRVGSSVVDPVDQRG